ncbi:hypothetical protein LTR56_012721 [Elasticomyces elasticus]|nr:hypothetical protein LTR22_022994 [Elasticomyces elasticus]KAK3638998.1 hypothetical protein LTR56_012721 [Elasticomyces elasticus]KAK4918748.1 hypothetical protein LTR49_013535 [Elasticomyces elasticus]KAK5754423.1 hypothetical protein LTS12_015492 [Elasticomyces elasticus]
MNASNPITTSTQLDMQEVRGQEAQVPRETATDPVETAGDISRLMSLPAELRNRIWEYVMSVGTVYVHIDRKNERLRAFIFNNDPSESAEDRSLKLVRRAVGKRPDASERPAGHECLSLLRSCKQIYEEAKQLFYVLNSFEVQAFNPYSVLDQNQMLMPGIFVDRPEVTGEVASAMVELMRAIGDCNAGVMTNVSFHFGQIDGDDLGDESAEAVVLQILNCLRPLYTSKPSWCFSVGMTLLVASSEHGHSKAERMELALNPQDIRQSKEAAIAAVVNRDSRGDLDEGLQTEFIWFLDRLQGRMSS